MGSPLHVAQRGSQGRQPVAEPSKNPAEQGQEPESRTRWAGTLQARQEAGRAAEQVAQE